MKKILTLIVMVAFSATMFGQTTNVATKVTALEGEVKTLKGQIETLNGQMTATQTRLNELADRNAEYKKALDIKQKLNANDSEGFQYALLSAIGNKEEQTITVTLSVYNTGEDRQRQFQRSQLTDYEGNGYEDWGCSYGTAGSYPVIDNNTSLKAHFTFKDVNTPTNRIQSLTILTQNESGKVIDKLNFRDIPVEWK